MNQNADAKSCHRTSMCVSNLSATLHDKKHGLLYLVRSKLQNTLHWNDLRKVVQFSYIPPVIKKILQASKRLSQRVHGFIE